MNWSRWCVGYHASRAETATRLALAPLVFAETTLVSCALLVCVEDSLTRYPFLPISVWFILAQTDKAV